MRTPALSRIEYILPAFALASAAMAWHQFQKLGLSALQTHYFGVVAIALCSIAAQTYRGIRDLKKQADSGEATATAIQTLRFSAGLVLIIVVLASGVVLKFIS